MKHKPFTRILSLLLVVATLAGLLAVPASAASLNGSGTVHIQYLGRHEYLSKSTGGSLSGSSWSYTSNDGLTGTAYCVNWEPVGGLAQQYDRSLQTMGVFANGYPMRTLEQFKDLWAEIHHIGNSINQIARSVNAGIARGEDAKQGLFLLDQVYELMYQIAKK